MKSFMASYQKKYLTLKEASIISGYTVKELRNFCKIGLVPSRKYKSKTFIRFDAFDQLNSQLATSEHKSGSTNTTKSIVQAPNMSLLPFTQPNRQLVSILQPTALAAALVMVLSIVSMPQNAERIVGAIMYPPEVINYMADATEELINTAVETSATALTISAETVAVMSDYAMELIEQSNALTVFALNVSKDTFIYMSDTSFGFIEQTYFLAMSVLEKFASMPVYASRSSTQQGVRADLLVDTSINTAASNEGGMVAGLATANNKASAGSSFLAGVENVLIAIADGGDWFQRFVTEGPNRAFYNLVKRLSFDSIDRGISETFRW